MVEAPCVTIDQVLELPVPHKRCTPFMGGRAIYVGLVANHFMERVWVVVRPSGVVRASPAWIARALSIKGDGHFAATGFRRNELLYIPPLSKEP
jgi:hypothetical protein